MLILSFFSSLVEWLTDPEFLKILLVGTKKDLKAERQVEAQEAQAFCKEKGLSYIECSAKKYDSVKAVFEEAMRFAEQDEPASSPKKKKIEEEQPGCRMQ